MCKLKVINIGCGCFTAHYLCEKCGKVLCNESFSWEKYHVGIGDKEKIKVIMDNKMKKLEINYCCKCGAHMEGVEEG